MKGIFPYSPKVRHFFGGGKATDLVPYRLAYSAGTHPALSDVEHLLQGEILRFTLAYYQVLHFLSHTNLLYHKKIKKMLFNLIYLKYGNTYRKKLLPPAITDGSRGIMCGAGCCVFDYIFFPASHSAGGGRGRCDHAQCVVRDVLVIMIAYCFYKIIYQQNFL